MLPLRAVETIPPPLFQLLTATVVPLRPHIFRHPLSLGTLSLSSEAACQGTSAPGRLMVKEPLIPSNKSEFHSHPREEWF